MKRIWLELAHSRKGGTDMDTCQAESTEEGASYNIITFRDHRI